MSPFILISALFVSYTIHVQGVPDTTCFTPDGHQGRCTSIYSCQHLMNMLRSPVSKETVAFVKGLRCEGPEQYSVCCGPPSTTPAQYGVCILNAAPPDPKTTCCGVQPNLKTIRTPVAEIDEYSWMALIEYVKDNKTKLLCGGALISGRYVLTAAHCVVGEILNEGSPTNVRLGEHNTTNDGMDCVDAPGGGIDCTDGITVIPIEKIVAHPQYDASDSLRRNDIALLRLSRVAPYTDFIKPICLPTTDVPESHHHLDTAGWGTAEGTSRSNVKQHTYISLVAKEECEKAYSVSGRNVTLWQGQMCAGGGARDSCKGDSGGPLMYDTLHHVELVGINSISPVCGQDNRPGIYTKVLEYNSWIRSQISP